MTPADARFGGRRGRQVLLDRGLAFELLDSGKVGVQFAHRFTTGLFGAYMTFEAFNFSALPFTDSLIF